MSSAEKLAKLLESSRDYIDDGDRPDGQPQRSKKEQMSLCHNVVDMVCSPQLRVETFKNLTEFNRLLGLSMELLLHTCEHADTDIRLVGDECLNRLIKGLMDSAIGRVIVELFKELRRNSSARTLKAALSRFADLCHLVRVQKCRQYVQGIIPVLAQVLQRDEETIQDCLSSTMPKLLLVFGRFMNDKDIKNLMTIPLARLSSPSASVRRMASSVLATVCQYSRKPKHFSALLVQRLMTMVFPGPAMATEGSLYLGVLMCLRHVLGPNLLGGNYEGSENSSDSGLIHDRGRPKELEVSQSELELAFSLLLYCSQHSDHNVVTASLETLQQLLRQPPLLLRKWLVSPGPLMGANEAFLLSDVASQLALACRLSATAGLVVAPSEFGLIASGAIDLNASLDSNALSDSFADLALESEETDSGPVARAENLDSHLGASSFPIGLQPPPSPGAGSAAVSLNGETASAYWPWQQNEYSRFRIPVVFAVNLLCSSFLLSGKRGGLIDDRKVRISVKSLALACVGAAVNLWPASLQGHVYPLSSASNMEVEPQPFRDILLFMHHSDQQLRGNVMLAVGYLLQAALAIGRGDFSSWSLEASRCWETEPFLLNNLVEIICNGLKDSSSMASRMACIAVRSFLPALMDSQQALESLQLLQTLLQLKSDTYWLVKAEVLDIFGTINYQLLYFLESIRRQQPTEVCLSMRSIQEQVFHSVVLPLLGDSDSRVQAAAAQALVKLVTRLYHVEDYGKQGVLTSMACQQAEHLFLPRTAPSRASVGGEELLVTLLTSSSAVSNDVKRSRLVILPAVLEANLSRVLVALNQMMLSATSVTLQIGVCCALKDLSDAYPVHQHSSAWCNVSCSKQGTASSFNSSTFTNLGSAAASAVSGSSKDTSSRSAGAAASRATPSSTVQVKASQETLVAKASQETLLAKPSQESPPGQESPGKVRRFFNKTQSTSQQSGVTSTSAPAEKTKGSGLFSFVSRSKASSTTSSSKENATAVMAPATTPIPKAVSASKLPAGNQDAVLQAEQQEENKRVLCQPGSLPLLISMMTSTPLAHDVQAHLNTLEISGRLLFAQVCHTLSNTPTQLLGQHANSVPPGKTTKEETAMPWPSFRQRALVPVAQRLLKHLVRLLNIHCHVMEGKDLPPLFSRETSKAQEKAGAPIDDLTSSLASSVSASPSKKTSTSSALQAPGKTTPEPAKTGGKTTTTPSPTSKEQSAQEAAAAAEGNQKTTLGSFYHLTHYRKLFEVCSGAYRNFKSTVDANAGDKFGSFLQATLNVLSLLLEIASSSDIVKHCEEIIGFLSVTMQHNASATLLCLQQVFRVVFESNTSYNPPSPALAPVGLPTYAPSMFSSCIELPRKSIVSAAMTTRSSVAQIKDRLQARVKSPKEPSQEDIEYEKRHLRRRFPPVPKCNMTHIGSCINHFEPLVVRALHVYITTHSTGVQHQILCLLMKLVNLRVNYAMLDADQKFVKSLMRQLGYMEQGHFIRDAGDIIPSMFQFLILLSYERHNVKAIVQVPQIIQLCDGIMASGEMAVSHAIPALEAIVNDLFILQYAGTDEVFDQEMDTQRDAVLAMLLRLVQRCQGLKLLTIALRHSQSRPLKWRIRSQMVLAMLNSRLSKQQVNIDDMEAVVLLRRTYSAITPDSIDVASILKLLLTPLKLDTATSVVFHRWLATMFVLLRVLLTFTDEEQLLAGIRSLGGLAKPFWCLPRSVQCPEGNVDYEQQPAKYLVYYLASVTCRAFHHISASGDHVLTVNAGHVDFVCQLTGHLLLVWQMILHTSFPKLAQASQEIVLEDSNLLPQMNSIALEMAHVQPVLLLSWSHVLLYCRFDRWNFWHQLLEVGYRRVDDAAAEAHGEKPASSNERGTASLSCNRSHRIVQVGAAALFSHFILKFGSKSTLIFLKRHCGLAVGLLQEPPVMQLIKSVQNSQQMGSVFLNVLAQQAPLWLNGVQWQHSLLQVVSAAHFGCLATLLSLLVCTVLPSPCLLPAFHIAVAKLAVQHIEKAMSLKDGHLRSLLSPSAVDELLAACNSLPKNSSIVKLVKALSKLKTQLTDSSEAVNTGEDSTAAPTNTTLAADFGKELYKKLVSTVCCATPTHVNPHRAATLLLPLDLEDVQEVVADSNFNVSLLSSCIVVGINDTLSILSSRESISALPLEDVLAGVSSPGKPAQLTGDNERSALLHSSIGTCFSKMEAFLEVDEVGRRRLAEGCHIGAALSSLCQFSGVLPKKTCKLEPEQCTLAVRFTLHLVRLLVRTLQSVCMPSCLDVTRCLNCLLVMLLHNDLFAEVNGNTAVKVVCQLIADLHYLIEAVVLPAGVHLIPSFSSCNADDERPGASPTPDGDSEQADVSLARERACDMMLALKEYLTSSSPSAVLGKVQAPYFLRSTLHRCVVCVCRLNLVNNFCRTPPLAWKMGWADALALSSGNSPLPPLPVDLLREKDLLADFIWRSNILGWTGRLQFEETWTSLLGMLISSPQLSDYPPEEQEEAIQISCMAVAGITSLLLASNLVPSPGHPPAAVHSQQPRQQELPFLGGRAGRRLCEVCHSVDRFLNGTVPSSSRPSTSFTSSLGITWKSDPHGYQQPSRPVIFTRNLDRPQGFTGYGFGQFSVNYLNLQVVSSDMRWDSLSAHDLDESESPESEPMRIHNGQVVPQDSVDVNSCIQLMEDLISQWLTAASSGQSSTRPPLYLQLHAARAATMLSDLFVEMQHFTWLLNTYLNLAPLVIGGQDDDILLQHLVVGICRAAAVCRADGNAAERVSQCVDTALRSSLTSTQVCGLQGSLYILECRCGADLKVLLPSMMDFISTLLLGKLSSSPQSEQLLLSTWTAAFIIVERYSHELKDNSFVSRLVQAAIKLVLDFSESVTPSVHHCVLQGLQRLLLSFSLTKTDSQSVMQLAIKRLNMSHSQCVASALSLLLTCMYTGKDVDRLIGISFDAAETEEEMMALRDAAFISLEKVTILLDRMRKSFTCDAKIVASVVPLLLEDFVDTTQAMNKMVSEVLTQHQPHPVILAVIMAQAFDTLRRRGLFNEIRDWVILSLGSFIQRSPVERAIWSLSCLFVSAANTLWVHSLFPYLLGRLDCVESDDRRVFLLSATDFYRGQNLLDDQLGIFMEAFQLHSPKSDLYLELLEQLAVVSK